MQNTKQFKVSIGGKDLVIETGLLAQQAAGAVTVSYGDTTVFTAVTNTDTPREGIDFFPLQCEYREKFYAAGKFPGGFFKREARPSAKEILTARMCDRPIRPLFPDGYYNDVQVNSMLIQSDGTREADFLEHTDMLLSLEGGYPSVSLLPDLYGGETAERFVAAVRGWQERRRR